ncbi:MAG: hypothetical protein AAF495_19150 [Pseudomonadota bacterium]
MSVAFETAVPRAHRRRRITAKPANEIEAERDYMQAVALFGAQSQDAVGAKRHLRMIRRFNHVYGWAC